MKRVLSVWLPHWPIDRLRRAVRLRQAPADAIPKDTVPFALTASGQQGMRLTAVNETARAQGIHPHMRLADAAAILPDLVTRMADPETDALVLRKLALWSTRYSPWTNTDGEDGLWLDVSGCAHLWGGEADMTADLARRLDGLGLSNRIGLADTAGAAWAVARFGTDPCPTGKIVPAGKTRTALAGLPVESLRLTQPVTVLLRRLGLKTVGSLYGVPRNSLARRFRSAELSEALLLRLDQALGNRREPLSPLLPTPSYRSRTNFPEPILETEAVVPALDALLEDLCDALARNRMGARQLTLAVYRVDGSTQHVGIGTSRGTRDARHLARLFKEKCAAIDPDFGIETLILSAERTEPLYDRQHTLNNDGQKNESIELAELIDRLSSVLGHENVQQSHPRASHIPERAEHCKAATGDRPSWSGAQDTPPRPFRLLPQPEPVDVIAEIPEGPPLLFTWRRVKRRILRAEGPERIAPEWWRETASDGGAVRDYYRVEDSEGHGFWVFREGLYQDRSRKRTPRWYVHGLFA